MNLGFGAPEVYSYPGKRILSSCSDETKYAMCTVSFTDDSPTSGYFEGGKGKFELSIYLLMTGMVRVGVLCFNLLVSGTGCHIALNNGSTRNFLSIGGEVLIIELQWENIISNSPTTFSEIVAYDSTENDLPLNCFRAHLIIVKRIPLQVSAICAIDEHFLLVCTEAGEAHRITWNGDMLSSWSLTGVHSVYRTSQPLTSSLAQSRVWGPSEPAPALKTPRTGTEGVDDESELGSEDWELESEPVDDGVPRRNGSIISRFSWSRHTQLASAVFEDGSLAFVHVLTRPATALDKGAGTSKQRVEASARPPDHGSPAPPKPATCVLMSNRLHPILPTSRDATTDGEQKPDTLGATAPAKWTVDVVSRFIDALLLDSSGCPADRITGLDPRVCSGDTFGDTGTLVAALVGTPLSVTEQTGPKGGDETLTLSVLLLRVAFTSTVGFLYGTSLGRRIALECACSLSVGPVTMPPSCSSSSALLPVTSSRMQWLPSPSGPVLLVLTDQIIRVLTVAPSGLSCMLISNIHITSPTPYSSLPVPASASDPSAQVMITMIPCRSRLVVQTVPVTFSTPQASSVAYLLPVLHMARSPTNPDAGGILLDPGDYSEVSSLLIFDPTLDRRTGRVRKRAHLRAWDREEDENFNGSQLDAFDTSVEEQQGGYVRVPLPSRLQAQLRVHRARGVKSGRSSSESNAVSGLLVASSDRLLVCVGGGQAYSGEALTTSADEAVPLIWLQDRRGQQKWRSIDLPEHVSPCTPEHYWADVSQQGDRVRAVEDSGEVRAMESRPTGAGPMARDSTGSTKSASVSASGAVSVSSSKASSSGWSVFGNCVAKPHKLPLGPKLRTTAASGAGSEFAGPANASSTSGPAQAVLAMSLFGPHSIVLVSVRNTTTTSGGHGHGDSDSDVRPSKLHHLEVVSREPARSNAGPSMSYSASGRRHVLAPPSLHTCCTLSPRLMPRSFSVLLLQTWTSTAAATATSTAHSTTLGSRAQTDGVAVQKPPNEGLAEVSPRDEEREGEPSENAITNKRKGTGMLVAEIDSEPSSSSYRNRVPSVASQDEVGKSAPTPAPAPIAARRQVPTTYSTCAVLVGDAWRQFHCYRVQAELQTVTPSNSSQTHLVATRYTISILWMLDLHSVLGPRPAIDFAYPIREATLIPSEFTEQSVPSSGDSAGKSHRVGDKDGTEVTLALLDGLGNLIQFEIRPFVPKQPQDSAVSNSTRRQIEVFAECIGQGYTCMERVCAPPDFPVPLRHALLLYPDGDAEVAAMESGTEFCCQLYFPLVPDLGLIPGPGLHNDGPTSLSPFGCVSGTLALHFRARSVFLPRDANPSSGALIRDGGSATVSQTSLAVHLLYGLVDAVAGVGSVAAASDVTATEDPQLDPAHRHGEALDKRTLVKDLLKCLRTHPYELECLVRSLERDWRVAAEVSRSACLESSYAVTSSILFSCDDQVLLEVVSRLARKLEPQASRRLFPLPSVDRVLKPGAGKSGPGQTASVPAGGQTQTLTQTSDSPWNQLALMELSLSDRRLHHCSRLLTLACDQIGGSTSAASCLTALVVALELLSTSMMHLSLIIAAECIDFCLRLELMARTLGDTSAHGDKPTAASYDGSGDDDAVEEAEAESWGAGLIAQLGTGIMELLSIPQQEDRSLVSSTDEPVSTFIPRGSSCRWAVAHRIEAVRGTGGFAALALAQAGAGSLTMFTIGLVATELLQAKRFYAASLLAHAVLFRNASVDAFVSGVLDAQTHPPSDPRLDANKDRVELSPATASSEESREELQTPTAATHLMEPIRAFRLQKVTVSALSAWLARPISSTSLRHHCEQEMEYSRLRRAAPTTSTSPSLDQSVGSAAGSVSAIDSSRRSSAHSAHGRLDQSSRSVGDELGGFLGRAGSFRSASASAVQIEIDESRFWQSRSRARSQVSPSSTPALNPKPKPNPKQSQSLAESSSPLDPGSETRRTEASLPHSSATAASAIRPSGATMGGVVRGLAAIALLAGDFRLSALLLVLLGRPDLAAACFRSLAARDLTADSVRRVHAFCASEGPMSTKAAKTAAAEAGDAVSDEELRARGLWEVVVQLRGVLLSHRHSPVSELVGKVVETLALLV